MAAVWFFSLLTFFFSRVCLDSPSKLFARAVLIEHLRKRASSHLLEVVEYHCFSAPEWSRALSDLDPNWILCFDSSVAPQGSDSALYFDALTNYHIMLLHCNVVLVPGLEFRGNDVDAWVKLERGAAFSCRPQGEWTGFVLNSKRQVSKAGLGISFVLQNKHHKDCEARAAVAKAAGERDGSKECNACVL